MLSQIKKTSQGEKMNEGFTKCVNARIVTDSVRVKRYGGHLNKHDTMKIFRNFNGKS